MKRYDVKIRVSLSTVIGIEAENENEAIEKAKEMYYNGDVMGYINESEYYDWNEVEVIDSEDIE